MSLHLVQSVTSVTWWYKTNITYTPHETIKHIRLLLFVVAGVGGDPTIFGNWNYLLFGIFINGNFRKI